MDYRTIAELTAETLAYAAGDFIGWLLRMTLVWAIRFICWLVPTCWRIIVVTALLVAFVARLSAALSVNVFRWWRYRYLRPYVDAGETVITTEFVGSYA